MMCTWMKCGRIARWQVFFKDPKTGEKGKTLGFNCQDHVPVKTAKDYHIQCNSD